MDTNQHTVTEITVSTKGQRVMGTYDCREHGPMSHVELTHSSGRTATMRLLADGTAEIVDPQMTAPITAEWMDEAVGHWMAVCNVSR